MVDAQIATAADTAASAPSRASSDYSKTAAAIMVLLAVLTALDGELKRRHRGDQVLILPQAAEQGGAMDHFGTADDNLKRDLEIISRLFREGRDIGPEGGTQPSDLHRRLAQRPACAVLRLGLVCLAAVIAEVKDVAGRQDETDRKNAHEQDMQVLPRRGAEGHVPPRAWPERQAHRTTILATCQAAPGHQCPPGGERGHR